MCERPTLQPGQRIAVHTPDQRQYRGTFVEYRDRADGSALAVVRLDTGWLTSYPVAMVHAAEEPPHLP